MSAVEGRNLVQNPNGAGAGAGARQEQLRHLQKEAFQLANYFFVFQGAIFAAFYNAPSAVKCRYRWIPFVLSLLSGLLNLCALLSIACKYKTLLDDIDRMAVARGRDQNLAAARGRDQNLAAAPEPKPDPILVRCIRLCRLLRLLFCMATFVGFLVITLIGSWKITCGGNGQRESMAVGALPPN